MTKEEFSSILADTGFKRPLTCLTLADVAEIESTLKVYLLLRVKPELDQLIDGLDTCGVLEGVHHHPEVMAPFFMHCAAPLTKGQLQVVFL